MRALGPQNPYEVYCFQCNVTAPVGTRRCVHCGGRLSGAPNQKRGALTELFEAGFTEAEEEEEEEEEAPTSVASAAPKIALWILLLIGGFLYRLCE